MANETFKFGGTKWAVKNGSVLAYNNENNNFKPLPFDFTRASTATRVNEDSLIEVVKSGIPRIDYLDNPNGHLLLEPSRTNIVPYSEDFSNGNWAKSNLNTTGTPPWSNVAIAPDGETTADKFIVSQDVSSKRHQISYTFSATTSIVSFSVFLKSAEKTSISIMLSSSGIACAASANLNNGTISIVYASNVISTSTSIEDYGSGWYRCRVTAQNTSSGINNITIYDDSIGDGISGVYMWGAQVEEGSYATSYIPTSGTTETRVAETCTGAGNAQVFNDSEGVLFAHFKCLSNISSFERVISIYQGTLVTNSIRINFHSSENFSFYQKYVGSVRTTNLSTTIINKTNLNKIAIRYNSSSFDVYVNGVEILTNADANAFTNPLNSFGFSNFDGQIKQIGVYDTALTDEELETLTT